MCGRQGRRRLPRRQRHRREDRRRQRSRPPRPARHRRQLVLLELPRPRGGGADAHRPLHQGQPDRRARAGGQHRRRQDLAVARRGSRRARRRFSTPSRRTPTTCGSRSPFRISRHDLERFSPGSRTTAPPRRGASDDAKGRRVDALLLGRLDGQGGAPRRADLPASQLRIDGELRAGRHHGDGPRRRRDDGKWLREHVEFFIVPIVDIDGVEDGDQGKNRKPRDHNRDYAGESIYPQVKAIRERLPEWSDGKLRLALDLHCPAHPRDAQRVDLFRRRARREDLEGGRPVQRGPGAVQTGPLVVQAEEQPALRPGVEQPGELRGRQAVRPLGRRAARRARPRRRSRFRTPTWTARPSQTRRRGRSAATSPRRSAIPGSVANESKSG